ncbi:MAG: 23S rRNA (guanosine(2251)-2'-O)-methyltransferase RlmB [Prolixibacteraceae bacterium]|nr:23S rRNA (guanosine(2251)-2'-O)-methyltransferase RlmB [Prolixibacteraceae bacterium]
MDVKKNMVMNDEFIFGTRAVIEAAKAGCSIDKILIKNGLNNELFGELYDLIKKFDIPYQYVPIEKINRITRKNHQGVLALMSPIDFFRIEDLLPSIYERGEDPLLLLLDQVSDVRNFGAIVRSAECAGVHSIVIPEKGAARIGPDAIKTSAGALNIVPICRTRNMNSTVDFLRTSGVKVVAATEKAEDVYYHVHFSGPVAIIMGAEDAGISPALLRKSDFLARVPIMGKIGSLNVSVAASLMMYEAVRQRISTE